MNIQMTSSNTSPPFPGESSTVFKSVNSSEYTAGLLGFCTVLIQRPWPRLSVRAASKQPRGKSKSKAVHCGGHSALPGGPAGRELVLLHCRTNKKQRTVLRAVTARQITGRKVKQAEKVTVSKRTSEEPETGVNKMSFQYGATVTNHLYTWHLNQPLPLGRFR